MARKKGGSLSGRWLEGTPDWQYDNNTIRVVTELETLPGWRVSLLMTAQDLRQVINLSVSPLEDVPEGGITKRALDRIDLGQILKATRAEFDRLDRAGFHMSSALRRSLDKALVQHPRPGRRGFPDHHYAAIAADYINRVVWGDDKVREFAARYHVSETRMRNMLTTARERGLLTSAPPGRVGGELTPKALDLLYGEM